MLQPQLERIRVYFQHTPPYERPVWNKALAWHYGQQELVWCPECGWDFGLWSDSDLVVWRRQPRGRRPFQWATGLWERIQRRREALKDALARSIASQGMPAEPDYEGPRRSRTPEGMPAEPDSEGMPAEPDSEGPRRSPTPVGMPAEFDLLD